ncbi:MAG: gluconate 2-dehydrogenase subunit 3 family protein [Gemmatimonadetes bacterium]|nr:gluconate 2-dehydrogenase subunit 3 family protein [Gemmatimonadota bacterium]
MADMNRRDVIELLALAPLAAAFDWTPAQVGRAAEHLSAARAAAQGAAFQPKFFTAHEYEIVRVLVDLIIPRDERSGSATDAAVPEFMDFIMTDGSEDRRTAMRGGLAWLDIQYRKRFGKPFVQCADAERTVVLDEIAWPRRAKPELSQGVAFFNSFRDLTAAGFFSSRMGVEDLQYQGNTFVPEWKGCPPEALRKLGVSYDRP